MFNKINVIFIVILINVTANIKVFYCENESIDERHEKDKYKYEYNVNGESNKYNKYIELIEMAKHDHSECETHHSDVSPCKCYEQFIESELSHWSDSGITEELINKTIETKRGIHYQIIEHKLYRNSDCLFPSRCEGIEHFINKIIDNLPDMELVINVHDYSQSHKRWNKYPIFSFSKDITQYNDITYPAWTFWCGGPAIQQYPTGIGRWDLMREHIVKYHHEWEHKESVAFFRGSRTSEERDPLILLSRSKPHLVNARYTKNQAFKSLKDTLNEEPAPTIPFEDQCKYKYLFNLRGIAASFRYKHLFLCNSLVLNVESDWTEFFYHQLKPWKHYVPIKTDLSDVENILMFLQENDNIAKDIANEGFNFIWKHLTLDTIQCYWNELLQRYTKLLRYKPKLKNDLIFIRKK